MPTPVDPVQKLRQRRDELRGKLAQVGDMRRGSLVERYRRCGKANCHCAREGEAGHGPSFSLTHAVDGKTITKVIPVGAVEATRRQISEYHHFRTLGQEFVEANERLCDAQLRMSDTTGSQEAAKKGASKGRSKPRS